MVESLQVRAQVAFSCGLETNGIFLTGISITFAIVLAVYVVIIVFIGVLGYRKTRTAEDFLVAGRSIGPWVGGAVLAATQISAGTFVGTVGRHYLAGVSWVWLWPGVWLGWLISALFVAPKLRDFGAVTIPDFLAVRYESRLARGISALLIIFGYMILLIAQYQACGEIFQAIFGLAPGWAMLMLASSTLLYTMLGGVRSSSYIDFLQVLIMLGGLVVAVPLLMYRAGGLTTAGQVLTSLDPRLTGWFYNWKQLLGLALSFGLTMAAAPYEMVRFYSMRDKATVRNAIGVCFAFQALIASCVMMIGVLMRVLFPHLASVDQTSSVMALNVLSPLAGSLFIIAMISAIMSSSNAILLVISAGISHDLYGKLLRPQSSDQARLRLNRVSILILGAVPIWFALQRFTDVQELVVIQTRFIASFFFVPMVFGLNSRFGTPAGALASMLGGCAGCLGWVIWGKNIASAIDAVEVGIAASALLYFSVSAFTRKAASA
jgi:SSS family transporter